MLIKAHELASASTLAPYLYIQLIWMVMFGYLVFSDVPGPNTAIGAAIIVASGLYLIRLDATGISLNERVILLR